MICDHCHRDVPVAPHFFNVTVPHVKPRLGLTYTTEPCTGNEKRTWRDGFPVQDALTLARQYAVLDGLYYWEDL